MKHLTILLLLALMLLTPLYSEDIKSKESTANVAELFEFHEVIYRVWHEAWPEKNTDLLKELLPEIEKGVNNITKAELPGILREKKDKWHLSVIELNEILKNYKLAAKSNDKKELLSQAEKLHSQFEKLVKLIKPSLKELNAFHEVLYKLYHYYLPEYDYKKIKESVNELKVKMEIILNTDLPDRFVDKLPMFNDARFELKRSVDELINIVQSGDNKVAITKAVEKMHTKYQALDNVFN